METGEIAFSSVMCFRTDQSQGACEPVLWIEPEAIL
jgi:hypothetical protein